MRTFLFFSFVLFVGYVFSAQAQEQDNVVNEWKPISLSEIPSGVSYKFWNRGHEEYLFFTKGNLYVQKIQNDSCVGNYVTADGRVCCEIGLEDVFTPYMYLEVHLYCDDNTFPFDQLKELLQSLDFELINSYETRSHVSYYYKPSVGRVKIQTIPLSSDVILDLIQEMDGLRKKYHDCD